MRSARPSAILNPPTVAALLVAYGACGYLVSTRSSLSVASGLVISAITAGAAVTGAILLMAKWALRDHGHSLTPEEEIHGQVAVVSRTITPAEPGEISYYAWNAQHVLPASSVDGTTITEGTEVVIETVDQGVARVELWSVVEQRL